MRETNDTTELLPSIDTTKVKYCIIFAYPGLSLVVLPSITIFTTPSLRGGLKSLVGCANHQPIPQSEHQQAPEDFALESLAPRAASSDNKETLYGNKEALSDNKEALCDNKEALSDKKEALGDNKEALSDNKESLSDNKDTLSDSKEALGDKNEGVVKGEGHANPYSPNNSGVPLYVLGDDDQTPKRRRDRSCQARQSGRRNRQIFTDFNAPFLDSDDGGYGHVKSLLKSCQ